jgi:hypothetical protein
VPNVLNFVRDVEAPPKQCATDICISVHHIGHLNAYIEIVLWHNVYAFIAPVIGIKSVYYSDLLFSIRFRIGRETLVHDANYRRESE